jgi:two-component system phosphate regulon sensor histidine kinase PhoR
VIETSSDLFGTIGPFLLLAFAAGLAMAATALIRLRRSVTRLADGARALAQGESPTHWGVDSTPEAADLRSAINEMAQALGRQVTAAEAEHAQLAAILETMADGVIVLDADGRVVVINRAAVELVGARADAAKGRSLVDVARDYELAATVRTALRDDTTQQRLIELGHPSRQVRIVCTPVIGSGWDRRVLLVLQDVTELQRADTIRREFVANVSHELRTPIAGLKALAETLANGALDDPPAARSFVERMIIEADRLAQLVEELLEIARLEGGRALGQPERVDLAALVARGSERLRPLAERHGVKLTVDADVALPDVVGDASRLERAVLNLVDNAVKFTDPGGAVDVRCWQEGSEVRVGVSDTGMGIAPEDQTRIFERFYKTDRARASGGAGLGLAIAKHTVQAMGGRIWAESVEGKGSTFFIALPLAGETVTSLAEESTKAGKTS